MKQPKLKLDWISHPQSFWQVDIHRNNGVYTHKMPLGCGQTEKTMWRGAIRNLKKLLAEAEKRLEELG